MQLKGTASADSGAMSLNEIVDPKNEEQYKLDGTVRSNCSQELHNVFGHSTIWEIDTPTWPWTLDEIPCWYLRHSCKMLSSEFWMV